MYSTLAINILFILLERFYLLLLSASILVLWSTLPARANPEQILYLAQVPSSPNPETETNDLPTAPLPDRERLPPEPSVEPLPPVEEFLESPPNQFPNGQVPDTGVSFTVRQFKVQGNTVLTEPEVRAILDKYRNRPLTFANLLEIETKLTKLYTDKGYINSGAVIPAQDVSQGIITIQAIEGRLEDIKVNVNGRLNEEYVSSRLQRGTNAPLNINELQEALQLLQLNPLIENLNAELSVGSSRDRWRLDVDVNQANAFNPKLFVNNSRTPSVGSVQRGVELTHNNFAGDGDTLSFVYKNTDGSNDYDANYTIPFNSLDGTVGFRYRYVKSDIIEEPFNRADIGSETDEYKLTIRQPILVSANSESTQELAVGLEFSRQANSTTVRGVPAGISPGAPEQGEDIGETKISALRFFQDWTRRTRKDVLAARSQFSVGLDIFDATVNVGAPDSKFAAWRGQIQWLRQLDSSANINLLVRSDLQISTDDLVPLEQFSLGGINSVRGYRQDALLSDSGAFVSAEVRVPVYRWSDNQSNISVIPFIDFGTIWSNSDFTDEEEDIVASVGVGVQVALSDTFRARLDYGIPLVEVEDRDDSLQEKGVYFSVEYSPL